MPHRRTAGFGALLLALALAPAAAAPALACGSSIDAAGTDNGDGTWHFVVTTTHRCLPDAEGFLSLTDDYEMHYFFDTCTGALECSIAVEGDALVGNCLRIAAFTTATLVNQNASESLCAP